MILARVAAAWLAGIAAASTLDHGAWPLALALAALLLAWSIVRHDRREAVYALVLPIAFLLALVRFETSRPTATADSVSHYNDSVAMRVRAVLRDDPDIRDTTQRFAADVREVQIRGEWESASGGVQVTLGLYPRYESGDVVELEGMLESPSNDLGFDYGEYLARRGIGSTAAYPKTQLVGHQDEWIARAAVLRIRRTLSDSVDRALPEPQSSLARGVLLGERSALPSDLALDLNATNTSHLVVVSGSNIVLVAAFATLLFTWIAGRRRASLLSILFVLLYAGLVGFSPPVARATIMGILLILARLSGRPASGITTISIAAAAMVGVEPSAARDVSFQLSFAATAGIGFLSSPIRTLSLVHTARLFRRDAMPRWSDRLVAEPLAMTLAAIIATEPLIALNFGRISLVAVPANMLVVPAFPFILGASLLAAIGGLVPHAEVMLGVPAYYALTYWMEVADHLAALPHAYTTVGGFGEKWTAAAYGVITALAFLLLRRVKRPIDPLVERTRPKRLRVYSRPVVIAVPLLVLVATGASVAWPSAPSRLQVTVLDVGQGDAILIEAPGGHDILIDGGPGPAVLRGLGGELRSRDRSLDLIVLTHPQADHMYGLIDVLDRYDVQRVLAGPGVQPSAGYDAFARAVSSEGRAIEVASEGMSLDLVDGVLIDVFGPGPRVSHDREINNRGVVLRITWRDVSFLLAADIEERAEGALLSSGADLAATVLKVPHHGSRTSSSSPFLAAVQPSISVVSSGADNRFGHPKADVVRRLAEYGPVYNTAEIGNVHFETDGMRVWITTDR